MHFVTGFCQQITAAALTMSSGIEKNYSGYYYWQCAVFFLALFVLVVSSPVQCELAVHERSEKRVGIGQRRSRKKNSLTRDCFFFSLLAALSSITITTTIIIIGSVCRHSANLLQRHTAQRLSARCQKLDSFDDRMPHPIPKLFFNCTSGGSQINLWPIVVVVVCVCSISSVGHKDVRAHVHSYHQSHQPWQQQQQQHTATHCHISYDEYRPIRRLSYARKICISRYSTATFVFHPLAFCSLLFFFFAVCLTLSLLVK